MADTSISLLSTDDNKSVVTTKIPPGGRSGQALVKASNRNYDVKWSGSVSGGSDGSCGCNRISIADIIKILNS